MSQHSTEPEFILADMEKTVLTGSLQVCLSRTLLNLEVDLVVLSKELTKLGNMSTRIGIDIRNLRQQELERE